MGDLRSPPTTNSQQPKHLEPSRLPGTALSRRSGSPAKAGQGVKKRPEGYFFFAAFFLAAFFLAAFLAAFLGAAFFLAAFFATVFPPKEQVHGEIRLEHNRTMGVSDSSFAKCKNRRPLSSLVGCEPIPPRNRTPQDNRCRYGSPACSAACKRWQVALLCWQCHLCLNLQNYGFLVKTNFYFLAVLFDACLNHDSRFAPLRLKITQEVAAFSRPTATVRRDPPGPAARRRRAEDTPPRYLARRACRFAPCGASS